MSTEQTQTPLLDLLDRVPEDIVFGVHGAGPFPSYTNIPIGKLAHQAAAELRRLHAANLDVLLHFNTLKADYDKLRASNAELLAALELARDHLDMNALAFTHCKDAAAINAAIANATKDKP